MQNQSHRNLTFLVSRMRLSHPSWGRPRLGRLRVSIWIHWKKLLKTRSSVQKANQIKAWVMCRQGRYGRVLRKMTCQARLYRQTIQTRCMIAWHLAVATKNASNWLEGFAITSFAQGVQSDQSHQNLGGPELLFFLDGVLFSLCFFCADMESVWRLPLYREAFTTVQKQNAGPRCPRTDRKLPLSFVLSSATVLLSANHSHSSAHSDLEDGVRPHGGDPAVWNRVAFLLLTFVFAARHSGLTQGLRLPGLPDALLEQAPSHPKTAHCSRMGSKREGE